MYCDSDPTQTTYEIFQRCKMRRQPAHRAQPTTLAKRVPFPVEKRIV